ncbi:hypothetical protein Dsin_001591, partial [Dipteronia sinensis]
MAKVIETGVALGVDFNALGKMGIFRGSWNLEEEIAKVIETRVTLIFDFKGAEQEMVQEIKRRELEDDSRLKGKGVDALGSTEGLITLWNDDLFKVRSCISNDKCIILVGLLANLNKEAVFCNIYAPNHESERKSLWDFLLTSQQYFPVPWCFRGDFNLVPDSSESSNGVCSSGSLNNFNSFVLKAKVIDIPMRGFKFKWSNHRENLPWARLDCYL